MISIIRRSLHGLEPLWKVFWIYSVIPSCALITAILVKVSNNSINLMMFILCLIFMLHSVFSILSILACNRNISRMYYSIMAQGIAIAWAINFLLISPFFLVDFII